MKTVSELYDRKQRAFRRLITRTHTLAKRAHPETGGIDLYCHNWGNDACRAVWYRAWARWRKYDAAYVIASDAAEHARHGPQFRPLWCAHCQH